MGVKVIILPGLPGSTLGLPRSVGELEPRYAEWIDGGSPLRPEIDPNQRPDIHWPPTTDAIGAAIRKSAAIDFERLRNPDLMTICPIWGYDAGLWAMMLPFLRVGFYSGLATEIRKIDVVEKKNVVGFGYDWRKNLIDEGSKLADFITNQMKWTKSKDRVVLVAHSTGGLVARAMIENPKLKAHPALKVVRALVTLGTPHLGTPVALQAALGIDIGPFELKPGLPRLAADPRYPGLYQLFPHPGQPALRKPVANDFVVDLYDPDVAAKLGLGAENLEQAKALQALLDTKYRGGTDIRYTLIAGAKRTTVREIILGEAGPYVFEQPEGDGTVPTSSATAPTKGGSDDVIVPPLDYVTHGDLLTDSASIAPLEMAIRYAA